MTGRSSSRLRAPWADLPAYYDQNTRLIRVTGTWCSICAYPMPPGTDDHHPLCDEWATPPLGLLLVADNTNSRKDTNA